MAARMTKDMVRYVALLAPHRGGVDVVFPQFPGCVSAGDTEEEAIRNAIDALRLHADGMRQDGEKLPKPLTVFALRKARYDWVDWEGAAAVLIPLLPPGADSERVNISIERGLLSAVDRAAAQSGLSRSAWLAEAAKSRLAS